MSNSVVQNLIDKTEEMLNILRSKNSLLMKMKVKEIPPLLEKEEFLIEQISSLKENILSSGLHLSEYEKSRCAKLHEELKTETLLGNKNLQAVYAVHNGIITFIKEEIEKTINFDRNYNFSGQHQFAGNNRLPAVSLNQTA